MLSRGRLLLAKVVMVLAAVGMLTGVALTWVGLASQNNPSLQIGGVGMVIGFTIVVVLCASLIGRWRSAANQQ